MNVSVTPELYELVQRKVSLPGLYGNAGKVVRDALRRMDERAIVDAAWGELKPTSKCFKDYMNSLKKTGNCEPATVNGFRHSYGLMTMFCILSVPFATFSAFITVVFDSCAEKISSQPPFNVTVFGEFKSSGSV